MTRRRPMFTTWLPVSLMAVGIAPLAACESTGHSAEAKPTPVKSEPPVPVTVAPVQQVPAASPIHAMGRVAHDRDVKLGFKTGGVIGEVLVDEGDRVTAGQVIARLDAREIDALVAQASAGVAKAKRDLDRAQGLAADQVIPGSSADDARTAARVASAQLAGARFNKETATLVAPVSGVIVKRLSEPGEVVGPGMPVLVIGADAADGATLIEAGIPARDALLVAIGDRAEVTLDGDLAPSAATVTELAPTLVAGTDQVLVKLRLAERRAVPRGLVARLELTPPRGGTRAAIPIAALVEVQGRAASVYTLSADGTHVERRPIVVDRLRPDGMVLVQSGLDGVSRVVDAGTSWLDSGAAVVVKTAAAATPKAGDAREDRP
ncbi:MAG: efflux RND transporter periplasmic adaptor subunit [Myxococcota bacterium]